MVGSDFFNLFQRIQKENTLTVEDFADRLNLFTVVILLVSCIFISAKQYVFNSISCYIPVEPSGGQFRNFLSDYCWVHGTIPIRAQERIPTTESEWDSYDSTRRITYYQWVPFVLGIQCIIFYLPHVVWQTLSAARAGGDIFTLVETAGRATSETRAKRREQVTKVTEFLEDMLEEHRCTRSGARTKTVEKMYNACGLCVVSKRMGTCLVMSYLFMKLLIIINCCVQLHIIQCFLGFSGAPTNTRGDPGNDEHLHSLGFGWALLAYIRMGREWPDTLLFPRVAYCRVPNIRIVGGDNAYTAQCTLPINMLNEKLYIFLWFWITLLLAFSLGSLLLWLLRILSPFHRHRFVRRYLRVHNFIVQRETNGRSCIDTFVDDYLRRDGIFLIRMVAINAGQLMASEIVGELWKNYVEREKAIRPPLLMEEKTGSADVGFV